MMGRPITNFKKHGWFVDIDLDAPPEQVMKIFCRRRSHYVMEHFQGTLSFSDLLARVYFQGLMDGVSCTEQKETKHDH